MPQKELIFLFHFYDNNDNKNSNSIDFRYYNTIKIEEYNMDSNEENIKSNIINRIVFIPELYSQLSKNNWFE